MRLPRISPRTYRWITLVTVVALAIIVVTGAAVRLTGSGLGCSDWPACTDNHFVSVTGYHRQIEQINRLFTGAGVRRRRSSPSSARWPGSPAAATSIGGPSGWWPA